MRPAIGKITATGVLMGRRRGPTAMTTAGRIILTIAAKGVMTASTTIADGASAATGVVTATGTAATTERRRHGCRGGLFRVKAGVSPSA